MEGHLDAADLDGLAAAGNAPAAGADRFSYTLHVRRNGREWRLAYAGGLPPPLRPLVDALMPHAAPAR